MAFVKSEEVDTSENAVFCQILSRDISQQSCSKTQGQKGCFGCAAPTRHCETCDENFVVVSATGTCSACTALKIKSERSVQIADPPKRVRCQLMKNSIGGSMCRSIQGQEGCSGCESPARICEKCGVRPAQFAQYGYCFTCSVTELGEGWTKDAPDESVRRLRVVTTSAPVLLDQMPSQEIQLLSQDFLRIPLAKIRDAKRPLRNKYDEDDLSDLGESMLTDKMIYPVVVEPVDENFYEVVIGSRRVHAARKRLMLDIPAFVVGPQNPLTKLILMLAENVHHVQLDPFEEGCGYLRLMREHGMDTASVAERVKRSTTYVKERMQLLSLPEDVQEMVANGTLALKNAATLASIPDEKKQVAFAQASAEHHLTQSELARKVRKSAGVKEPNHAVIPYAITPEKFSAKMEELTQWFERALPRLDLRNTNVRERLRMTETLTGLETKVRMFKEMIRSQQTRASKPSASKK